MIGRRTFLGAGAAFALTTGQGRAEEALMDIDRMVPGDFSWRPDRSPAGAVAIIASLPEQRVHVYRNGVRIGVSTCSTGKPGHETPTGVFTILQKDAHHRSSTYGGAPMPNMNRLTWGGIALHAGKLPGYPASHGCIRLPMEFSRELFTVTHIGTPVIIAGARSDPWELTHPGVILEAYGEAEMETAVAALEGKSAPSDWASQRASNAGDGPEFPITTILVTGADRRILIMEDGREVMSGDVTMSDPGLLGEHVFVLQAAQDGALRWTGMTHHPDPTRPLLAEEQVLNRMRLPREINDHIRGRLHPGLTFVVSDQAATPDRRSDNDFVIMTADVLTPPRPHARPAKP